MTIRKWYCITFSLIIDNLHCFGSHPLLIRTKDKRYGDICRKANFPTDKSWKCPKGCTKTKPKKTKKNKKQDQPPFCQTSKNDKSPCRKSKGTLHSISNFEVLSELLSIIKTM